MTKKQAEWKAVWPMMSLAFRSMFKVMEFSMNILTTLEWPSPHAKWKDVSPKISIALILMLRIAEHEYLGYIMMTKSACHMESFLTFFVFALWVFRAKKVFWGFDNIFHVYLMRGFHKYGRNWVITVVFEGRLRQDKKVLPDGLNWLCYFAGSSKSHCENSISFIFL